MPGHWLLRFSTGCCSQETCEQILKPLIADLQREWWAARGSRDRASARWRGTLAFWQAIAVCGVAAVLRRIWRVPADLTFDRSLIIVYGMLIAAVSLFGVEWVETGRVTVRGGLTTAAQFLPMAPQFLWLMMYRRVTRWQSRVALAAATLAVSAGILFVIPGSSNQPFLMTSLVIAVTPALARFEALIRRRAS